jgi:hypothetical protein
MRHADEHALLAVARLDNIQSSSGPENALESVENNTTQPISGLLDDTSMSHVMDLMLGLKMRQN